MSQIKSLAEQLKYKLEEQRGVDVTKHADNLPAHQVMEKPEREVTATEAKRIAAFLSMLQDFNMDGQEKMLIRLDKRTVAQLKQLKVATNIDMTRVIAFALHHFLKSHPWLNNYISQTLKQMAHELD